MKLLVTADIHIGRRPTHAPVAFRDVSCAAAWLRLVELALSEGVQAVLVAGDLVDSENRFFEARGPLGSGLSRLSEAGIELLLVAGNHDVLVLPELVKTLPESSIRLLGAGGTWESCTLADAEGRQLEVVGWSYPSRIPPANPLDAFPVERRNPGIPTVGMLHSDVGLPSSPYCGTSMRDFAGLPVDMWVLGHVHKPGLSDIESGPRILVPGSPQGMDPGPGELGPHGPWLVDWTGGRMAVQQRPTAPFRYERVAVDLPDGIELNSVPRIIWDELQQKITDLVAEQPGLEAVCAAVDVKGRAKFAPGELKDLVGSLLEDGGDFEQVAVTISDLTVDVRPPVDIDELIGAGGLLGRLAEVASGSLEPEAAAALESRASRTIEEALSDSAFRTLNSASLDVIRQSAPIMIRRQAWRLLHELLPTAGGEE